MNQRVVDAEFFRALEARRTQALVDREAKITFPSGKVVDCWHTDTYVMRDGAWKAIWSQATQLAQQP